MEGLEKVKSKLNEMSELREQYADYKLAHISSAQFYDPETEEQKTKANKVVKSVLAVYYMISVVFIASFIGAIFLSTQIIVTVLIGLIMVFVVALTLGAQFKKVQIFKGKAVYKQARLVRVTSKRRRNYTYVISVIPDSGEKVIYREIQVSKNDFDQIEEGTPVMVINSVNRACVL